MPGKQEYISNMWIERAKEIHNTADVYNLTALRGGVAKHNAEVAFLQQTGLITQNTSLLDLGCGNGRLCKAFVNEVGSITGTDLCDDFIAHLNRWKSENEYHHTKFFKLDLLEADYKQHFNQSYSLILLFGTTQLIINDDDLIRIFKNIKNILATNACLLIKQTTSLSGCDIHIDHYSADLNQRWIANYRTADSISKLFAEAGLKVETSMPIYNPENLKDEYSLVEKWQDTRQYIFKVAHS